MTVKILSCGAGMQSTALALMSCENTKDNKYPLIPVYDAIIFCDLGKEPPWVYDQVQFILAACNKAGIPFYILDTHLYQDYVTKFGKARVVTVPFWSVNETGKKGKMTRHCTIDYKILAIQKFFRWTLLGYKKGQRTKPEDIGAHEMHIGFSEEEQRRIFDSHHPMFVNKFPLVEMRLERKDNYAYIRDVWGLETKASACQFCPFHTNYFFQYLKKNHGEEYADLIEFDKMLEQEQSNTAIQSKIYISRSRKRIEDLMPEDCKDKEWFKYKNEDIWNGF
jgi:hypothetical protein